MSLSLADSLASLNGTERTEFLKSYSDAELAKLEWDWKFWGRPEQQIPPDVNPATGVPWIVWMILAGRGFGKTRTGAETIRDWACGSTPLSAGKYCRFAVIGETAADARDVLVEGESGILSVHPKAFRPLYEPSKRRLTWPNGAVATLYNAVEPDQLRGPQHDAAWCDELAKWMYAQETWDQLMFGLRLPGCKLPDPNNPGKKLPGAEPRAIVTTTPRPIPVVKAILADATTVTTRGKTTDNKGNLAKSFITTITKRFQGTRLGRQELDAEVLDDVPGALWTREMIDVARKPVMVPDLQRIVVAIDPSGTSGKDAGDNVGIVAAGFGVDGRVYVLADWSCKLSPAGWGRRAVDLYTKLAADRIIAERNYGGAMVEHVIRTTDENVPYTEVVASRGKVIRAEPIAALYEQGRVSHAPEYCRDPDAPERISDELIALEDQMCQMAREGYLGDGSPDRVDALVWAITELVPAEMGPAQGIYQLVERKAKAIAERVKPEPPKPEPAPGSVEYMLKIAARA